jgi:putative SOS response-associated peptidase YedK
VCGRLVQVSSSDRLAAALGAVDTTTGALHPRHNVAPSTAVAAVLTAADQRRLGTLRWGFVPTWARDPSQGPRPINARAEGAATSRLFGPALRERRCVVPADGWYEWRDEGGHRQPFLLRDPEGTPLALAALWSTWRDPTGALPALATVTVVTTAAAGTAATVHDRMPLVLTGPHLDGWLDPAHPDPAALLGAATAVGASDPPDLEVRRVSRRVNDVRNDDPSLLDRVEPEDGAT